MEFEGRVALVTGASRGIGRCIADDLARRGVVVVGVARGADAMAEAEAAFAAAAPGSWTRSLDVGDAAQMGAFVSEVIERHGRLDILINNAALEEQRTVSETSFADIERLMKVNFDGVVASTLAAVPHMLERGEGWIVNVISGAGRVPLPRQAGYSASKAAVAAFSESISYELVPHGVRVKVLSPGFVAETQMAQAAVRDGMALPPKIVHRTPDQVVKALVRGLDRRAFEINLSRLEAVAPAFRALFPSAFRKNIQGRSMNGTSHRKG